MKKIIALVVAVLMMAAIAVPAFAAWDTENNAQGNVTEVTFGVTESYVVSIPQTVTFSGLTATAVISASGVMIAGNTSLRVTVSSTQYHTADPDVEGDVDSWVLVDRAGNSDPVNYMIKVGETNVVSGTTEVLTVASKAVFDGEGNPIGNSGTATLNFSTLGTSQVAAFKDTLTFAASVS